MNNSQTISPDLIIIPDTKTNRDFPSIAAGLLSTHWNIPVIDFNTIPGNESVRVEGIGNQIGIVGPSRSSGEIDRLTSELKTKAPLSIISANGPIDIQCCYPLFRSNPCYDYNTTFDDHLPFPDYTQFDTFAELQSRWEKGDWYYPIMTSLGCPFSCSYCACRKRKVQSRSISNCMEELIRAKEKWEIKRFVIIDDCFNADKKRAKKFASAASSLGLEWMVGNGLRADQFNEELGIAMRLSGCRWVAFGVESTDNNVLKSIRKGVCFEEIDKAIRTAKECFDYISVFLIIGLPGSSYEIDRASIGWAKNSGINAHVSFYVPLNHEKDISAVFDNPENRELPSAYDRKLQIELYEWAKNR